MGSLHQVNLIVDGTNGQIRTNYIDYTRIAYWIRSPAILLLHELYKNSTFA